MSWVVFALELDVFEAQIYEFLLEPTSKQPALHAFGNLGLLPAFTALF